jgi:hypothetical protein
MDISRLTGFVTANEQQVNDLGPPGEINSVARAEINSHFRNHSTQSLDITKVPVRGTVKAIENDGLCPEIL